MSFCGFRGLSTYCVTGPRRWSGIKGCRNEKIKSGAGRGGTVWGAVEATCGWRQKVPDTQETLGNEWVDTNRLTTCSGEASSWTIKVSSSSSHSSLLVSSRWGCTFFASTRYNFRVCFWFLTPAVKLILLTKFFSLCQLTAEAYDVCRVLP